MSDFVLTGLESYDFKTKSEKEKKSSASTDRKLTVLKIIVIILCVLLFIEAILYMLVIPCLVPAKIYYKGNSAVSSKHLDEALMPLKDITWMKFNTTRAKIMIKQIPSVKDVDIVKSFPDRVQVNIIERKPVAKTIVQVDNVSKSVQIDEKGVLFPITTVDEISDTTIPLISGLQINSYSDDTRIMETYRPLLEDIEYIRSLPQNYFAAVSEIQVVQKEYGNYELVLYPVNSRVRFLTERNLSEDQLKSMMVVLDIVNQFESDVYEVDLRYGSVSYRRKGESGGNLE